MTTEAPAVSSPVVRRPHPRGAAGIKVSLDEVVKKIREGRLDPRVRAWAGEQLVKRGRPQGVRDQAQAILDGLKAHAMYALDPVDSEFVVAAALTLCLDERGLCFKVADCDDMTVAYSAATLSIGIPTAVVAQSFEFSGDIGHVLAVVHDGHRWWLVDPSTNLPVGKSHAPTREVWIDPLTGRELCDKRPRCDGKNISGEIGQGRSHGDYVGVGRLIPHAGPILTGSTAGPGALGQVSGGVAMDWIPFALWSSLMIGLGWLVGRSGRS